MLKATAKAVISRLAKSSISLLGTSAVGRFAYAQFIESAMTQARQVSHGGVALRFATPNALNEYRASTFASKEPETLEWINDFPSGSVFWDIGANVGLYSCYAAKCRGCDVYAFEPSVFNLETLARNIYLNDVVDLVTIVPLAMSARLEISALNMTSTNWGGALSSFGQTYGFDGAPLETIFRFRTIGLAMTDAVNALRLPTPDYIKMDVDGIEHLILGGGRDVLQSAKSVLVEINDTFDRQATESRRILEGVGLRLVAKRHAKEFDEVASEGRDTFNQIWIR